MSHINIRLGGSCLQIIWWPRWPLRVALWQSDQLPELQPPAFYVLTLPLIEFRWWPKPQLRKVKE